MKNRMKLIRLTLVGTRKDYVINFRDGLNYISGHTSTGKTSILEMIDYALGSGGHKSYIEIGNSCIHVMLEFSIGDEQFRLKRDYFDANAAVIVEEWNEKKNEYIFYNRYEVTSPNNPNSLSAFLIEKLGFADITIMNDRFSFRDIFKYSYLKQTELDNEDIMGEASQWALNTKRKATFEIIFRIFNEQLQQYKTTLKAKQDEQKELETRLLGVKEFLQAVSISSAEDLAKRSLELSSEHRRLRDDLLRFKQNDSTDTDATRLLRQRILDLRERLQAAKERVTEQSEYKNKLRLLHNQYASEINRKQMAIDGYFAFNQYDFLFCPNCLKPLHADGKATTVCCLCGKERTSEPDELLVLKKEHSTIKRKANELLKFITEQDERYQELVHAASILERTLTEVEQELTQITSGFVNPHLEQIEILNYEIGRNNRQQHELEQSLKAIEELERLEQLLLDKAEAIEKLKDTIKGLSEGDYSKDDIIERLTNTLTATLRAFEYPKLSNSYVDNKNYLPYVRGRKYNDIGSLAGVSLITMAYYLSILIEGSGENFGHLNLLMIDSPRKNLGAQEQQAEEDEEFKDEKIFHSVIRWMVDFCNKNAVSIQLIVVNNGYPDFLPKETIVAEYDSEGRHGLLRGLIDDAE
jgi:DNA repair ATPase RecN